MKNREPRMIIGPTVDFAEQNFALRIFQPKRKEDSGLQKLSSPMEKMKAHSIYFDG
jgi:hypothetical protein